MWLQGNLITILGLARAEEFFSKCMLSWLPLNCTEGHRRTTDGNGKLVGKLGRLLSTESYAIVLHAVQTSYLGFSRIVSLHSDR